MADIDTNNGIMEVTSHEDGLERSDESVNIMDGSIDGQGDEDVCEDDILQQALVEASSFPDGVQIQYSTDGVGLQESSIINTGDEGTTFIASANGHISAAELAEHFENGSYQVLAVTDGSDASSFVNNSVTIQNGSFIELPNDDGLETEYVKMEDTDGANGVEVRETQEVLQNDLTEEVASTSMVESPQPQTKQIQLNSVSSAAPLGSSLNPIRIIQQGNQYTPVQQLSSAQLQQIMQVVQQQQIAKSLDSGSSVLYNQQTNTRIVYRVIYPSDLHKDGSNDGLRPKGQQALMQNIPKRPYKKRNKEDEQDRIDGPELSKEEKEARKKQRAKTRSGRVSKPPKHMVKDYKHIHVLDYDEDYDDSDGGYSDYKVEANEEEEESGKDDFSYVAPGINSCKPKNWKCISCDKAYIGRAGLARHLKLYPSHGSLDPEGDGDMEPPPPGTVIVPTTAEDSVGGSSGVSVTPNGLNSTASLSEDSRDSTYSLPYTPSPAPRPRGQRGRPRGSRSWRSRGAWSRQDIETRRRNKLKEVTRECSDEELMEIVLPRLAKVITLWEFLLMKVEIGDPATPHAGLVYKEYEKLHHNVKKLCQEYLQFVPESEADKDSISCLQIENDILAQALGLQKGCHKVKDIAASDIDTSQLRPLNSFQNKIARQGLKRVGDVVSSDVSSTKRTKLTPVTASMAVPQAAQTVQSSGAELRPDGLIVNTGPLVQATENNSLPSQPRLVNLISSIGPAISSVAASLNSVPTISTTGVILTNSLPQSPIILQGQTGRVSGLNPGQSPAATSGRPASSRATVSLLNDSKILPAKPESQKFIILSGGNPGSSVNIPISSPMSINTAANSKANTGLQQIVQQSSSASQITSNHLLQGTVTPNVFSSSALILPAPASNTSSHKSASVSQQQPVTLLPVSVAGSHPLLLSIPHSSQSQSLLPSKLMVSDPGGTNQNEPVESLIPGPEAQLKLENNAEEMLDADQVLNPVENDTSFISDDATYSLTGDVKENGALDGDSVVYTLQDGDADDFSVSGEDSSQTNIVYAVDPKVVLANKSDSNSVGVTSTGLTNSIENGSKVISRNSEEVVGVLNSIDNRDTVKISSFGLQSSQESAQQSQTAANAVEMNNQDDSSNFVEYQPESTESDAMSATIFQLEDGAFIIQNADGSTLQLQGSDGQSLSMETVQALLAMDGGTEFITEQGGIT